MKPTLNPSTVILKNGQNMIELNFKSLQKTKKILRAIDHELRLQIIKMLSNGNRLTVTDLYIKLRMEQSVASQHLATLKDVGLLDTIREGKFIYYTLNTDRLSEISEFVENLCE